MPCKKAFLSFEIEWDGAIRRLVGLAHGIEWAKRELSKGGDAYVVLAEVIPNELHGFLGARPGTQILIT